MHTIAVYPGIVGPMDAVVRITIACLVCKKRFDVAADTRSIPVTPEHEAASGLACPGGGYLGEVVLDMGLKKPAYRDASSGNGSSSDQED